MDQWPSDLSATLEDVGGGESGAELGAKEIEKEPLLCSQPGALRRPEGMKSKQPLWLPFVMSSNRPHCSLSGIPNERPGRCVSLVICPYSHITRMDTLGVSSVDSGLFKTLPTPISSKKLWVCPSEKLQQRERVLTRTLSGCVASTESRPHSTPRDAGITCNPTL